MTASLASPRTSRGGTRELAAQREPGGVKTGHSVHPRPGRGGRRTQVDGRVRGGVGAGGQGGAKQQMQAVAATTACRSAAGRSGAWRRSCSSAQYRNRSLSQSSRPEPVTAKRPSMSPALRSAASPGSRKRAVRSPVAPKITSRSIIPPPAPSRPGRHRSARCVPKATDCKRTVIIGRGRRTAGPALALSPRQRNRGARLAAQGSYSQSLRRNTQYKSAPEPSMITVATMKPTWLLKPGYGTFIP